MRKLTVILGSLILVVLLAGVLTVAWLRYFGDEGLPFRKFYRVQVEFSLKGGEPVTIDYVMGCRVTSRKFFAQPTDYAWVRVPIVFGVRTKGGEGVLTETPDVCDFGKGEPYGLDRQVPPDFLPINFHAENADNLEFFTAYLSERAYEQPFSKLTFHRATVAEVTDAEYAEWKRTAAPNIVPEGRPDEPDYHNFFNGKIFPETDYRYDYPIECRSLRRSRIPDEFRAEVRAQWPADRPTYWMPAAGALRLNHIWLNSVVVGSKEDPATPPNMAESAGGLRIGRGLNRPGGQGALLVGSHSALKRGVAKRMPVYDDILLSKPKIGEPVHQFSHFVTMDGGADQGFAACFRRYRYREELQLAANTVERVYLDAALIDETKALDLNAGVTDFTMIERDEYVFGYSTLQFVDEFARQQ